MYQIVRSEKADDDLEAIADYIALDNPTRAVTFVEEMINSFSQLISSHPKAGKQYKKFYYSVYNDYFIFYDIYEHKKEILIVRIINSSQYTEYEKFF